MFEGIRHGIGLTHTGLSILDLSPLGHQPMAGDAGWVIMGRYITSVNYGPKEVAGHVFRGHSDTEGTSFGSRRPESKAALL